MFCQLNFGIGLVAFVLFMNEFVGINGQCSYTYCDNDYNTSSCANTTLESNIKIVQLIHHMICFVKEVAVVKILCIVMSFAPCTT